MKQKLTDDQLRHIVQYAPLVSIDLVIENPAAEILVALRNNEPAKGFYFVPGGMVLKNETRASAFRRILLKETGLDANIDDATFLGVYEHHYDRNRFNSPDFGTHYVVLGYRLHLVQNNDIRLDEQHSRYRWMSKAELLASPDVHDNTKAFLTDLPRGAHPG